MKRKEWNIKFKGSTLIASFVVCFLQPSFLPPQVLSEKQENGNVVFLKVDVDDAQVSHPMSFFALMNALESLQTSEPNKQNTLFT